MIEIKFPGYLGLNEVEANIRLYTNVLRDQELYINLSEVSMFDVGGILLLLVWLQLFRANGTQVKFRLPEIESQKKARDFLKKWRFDRALSYTFNDDLTRLLEDDQINYFEAPLEYYTDAQFFKEYGQLAVLKSHNLLEILPITEITSSGNSRVSKAMINQIADSLSLQSVIPILQSAIGASPSWSEKFGRLLVYQALLNTFEHPDATIAFVAIAKKPNPNGNGSRLVISVADNGLTISDTIHNSFIVDSNIPSTQKEFGDSEESQFKMNSNKVVYATKKFTSSKPLNHPDPERGMGLYYLRTMTSEVNGETIIRCKNTSIRFTVSNSGHVTRPEPRRVQHMLKGNIIRITIPTLQ
jgi:hypothetical protein